jgi:hypothetical protein
MRKSLLLLALFALLAGCEKKPEVDYTPLDQAGMWISSLRQVKNLKVSNAEVAQLTSLKRAGAGDDLCLALLKAARDNHHPFTSGDSAVTLSRAGYSDAQILEMAEADKLDMLSADAVMLKLLGLSEASVQYIMHRRTQGLPSLTSAQIGRLKNVGMSEQKILDIVNQGWPEAQAEEFITKQEASRNHSHTDFVRVRGRKPR